MFEDRSYLQIVSFCESFLARFGDCHLGVGWTKTPDTAQVRYRVMLDVLKDPTQPVSILDFGCGASHLLEHIRSRGLRHIEYSGLDLSEKFLELSRAKFPGVSYYHLDILRDASALPQFDYVLLNGIFNSRCQLTFDEMFAYFQAVVTAAFAKARIGIAFNVMSKLVDWERDDLFHLPFEKLTGFLAERISRQFTLRHDYGLYEYTTYVYR
jgi:SAM-dependent methyltransferase